MKKFSWNTGEDYRDWNNSEIWVTGTTSEEDLKEIDEKYIGFDWPNMEDLVNNPEAERNNIYKVFEIAERFPTLTKDDIDYVESLNDDGDSVLLTAVGFCVTFDRRKDYCYEYTFWKPPVDILKTIPLLTVVKMTDEDISQLFGVIGACYSIAFECPMLQCWGGFFDALNEWESASKECFRIPRLDEILSKYGIEYSIESHEDYVVFYFVASLDVMIDVLGGN